MKRFMPRARRRQSMRDAIDALVIIAAFTAIPVALAMWLN